MAASLSRPSSLLVLLLGSGMCHRCWRRCGALCANNTPPSVPHNRGHRAPPLPLTIPSSCWPTGRIGGSAHCMLFTQCGHNNNNNSYIVGTTADKRYHTHSLVFPVLTIGPLFDHSMHVQPLGTEHRMRNPPARSRRPIPHCFKVEPQPRARGLYHIAPRYSSLRQTPAYIPCGWHHCQSRFALIPHSKKATICQVLVATTDTNHVWDAGCSSPWNGNAARHSIVPAQQWWETVLLVAAPHSALVP